MSIKPTGRVYEYKVNLPGHPLDNKVPEGYEGSIQIKFSYKPVSGSRSIHLKRSSKSLLTLSIMGRIQFGLKGGSGGGQCQDLILKYWGHLPQVAELCELWNRWHLNDLRSGTKSQMEAVRNLPKCPISSDWYTWACLNLKTKGLLEDRGYKFGSEWLFEVIPPSIVRRIKILAKEIDTYR